jgi:hypothetical protein
LVGNTEAGKFDLDKLSNKEFCTIDILSYSASLSWGEKGKASAWTSSIAEPLMAMWLSISMPSDSASFSRALILLSSN